MRVLTLLLTIALTAPCSTMLGQERTADEAAIRGSIAALESALNAHDAAGGARLFKPSIRFVSPDVALVDVEGHLVESPSTSKDRAFYVMVRRGGAWQIAALRVYAPQSS